MSFRQRKHYSDDDYEFRYRGPPRDSGRRGGRYGVSKYRRGGRGGRFGYQSKAFEKNVINHVRNNKFHDGHDYDELIEQDPVKWHKLSVIYGSQVGEEWILNKLRELSNEDLYLTNYQTEGKNAVAFVHTRDSIVKKIRRQLHNFLDPSGKRLTVNMISVSEPSVSRVNEMMEENIKLCLNTRYSFDTKILDLSSFNKDAHLQSVNLYLTLSRQAVVQFVIRILLETLEELNGLNVSNNQLETLVPFEPFAKKFPNMKTIDVSFNRFRHDGVMDVFRTCTQIESINLQGNPFFRSQNIETYGTIIRRRFPNLLRLNGKNLPPRIKFGGESTKSLPEPTLGYFPSQDMQTGIVHFLKNFYDRYDSGKRESLLTMYADDAILTLVAVPSAQDVHQKCSRYSDSYFSMSRNLLRIKDEERRKKLICHGKLQAVSTLDRLPKTEHFLDSFRVDVLYRTETTIFMNVVGVYRENEEHGTVIRLFTRTLQIEAPELIKVDSLMVSHPNMETAKKYRNLSSRSTPVSEPEPVVSPQTFSSPVYTPSQDELVRNMMKDTGMNEMFSRRCLMDFNYDYKSAIGAYLTLKNANKMPPEAYF